MDIIFPNISAAQTSVTTSATLILAANRDARFRRIRGGANPVFLGGGGVTSTTGHLLAANEVLQMDDCVLGGAIYGITTTSTSTVTTLEG